MAASTAAPTTNPTASVYIVAHSGVSGCKHPIGSSISSLRPLRSMPSAQPRARRPRSARSAGEFLNLRASCVGLGGFTRARAKSALRGLTCGYGGQRPASGLLSHRCALHLDGEHSTPAQVRATWRRSVEATAQIRHRIAASTRRHPSRSTACLRTLHEPWGVGLLCHRDAPTCMVCTRRPPRSERPGGRADDVTAELPRRITASLRERPRRSTACLTTLQEPCLTCKADFAAALAAQHGCKKPEGGRESRCECRECLPRHHSIDQAGSAPRCSLRQRWGKNYGLTAMTRLSINLMSRCE
jgi:hypothetical protein